MNKILKEIEKNESNSEKKYFIFHRNRFLYTLKMLEPLLEKHHSFLDLGSCHCHMLMGTYFLGCRNLYGVDLEVRNNTAKERAIKFGIDLKNCDLSKNNLPFDDKVFDIILFSETLEHFNFHPKSVFREIHRVLKPEGKIIITTPNLLRLNNRIKLMLGQSIHSDIRDDRETPVHFREYAAGEIVYLMESTGLKVLNIKFADFNYPAYTKLHEAIKFLNKIVGFVYPGLKGNIVIVGER